jgi:hypothetical protein
MEGRKEKGEQRKERDKEWAGQESGSEERKESVLLCCLSLRVGASPVFSALDWLVSRKCLTDEMAHGTGDVGSEQPCQIGPGGHSASPKEEFRPSSLRYANELSGCGVASA